MHFEKSLCRSVVHPVGQVRGKSLSECLSSVYHTKPFDFKFNNALFAKGEFGNMGLPCSSFDILFSSEGDNY